MRRVERSNYEGRKGEKKKGGNTWSIQGVRRGRRGVIIRVLLVHPLDPPHAALVKELCILLTPAGVVVFRNYHA